MDYSVDIEVSRAVFMAHQAERALHDGGKWEMSYGPLVVPAERIVHEHGVSFVGNFTGNSCWVRIPDDCMLILCCDGDTVATREIEHPGDGPWGVEWSLAVTSHART